MKALFDTNIVLDVLLDREPHAEAAASLLGAVERGELPAILCATTLTTINYLVAKATNRRTADNCVGKLLELFDVAAVNRAVLHDALALGLRDYEDAVLHEAARHAGATLIVTRNAKDFRQGKLRCYNAEELLALLAAVQ